MKQVKRDKAALGTAMIIGSVISSLLGAGSQIFGAKKQADAMKEQNANNLFAQNFNNALNQQQNLRAVYNNNDELNLLQRNNVLRTINQFNCGGRKMVRK